MIWRKPIEPVERSIVGGTGKKSELPDQNDGKPKKPPPRPVEEDEDGDIATPKRDRYGNDDEPL